MAIAENIKDTKGKDMNKESGENRYPSLEVAEARLKQALLRYKVAVERITPTSEKAKVRL